MWRANHLVLISDSSIGGMWASKTPLSTFGPLSASYMVRQATQNFLMQIFDLIVLATSTPPAITSLMIFSSTSPSLDAIIAKSS